MGSRAEGSLIPRLDLLPYRGDVDDPRPVAGGFVAAVALVLRGEWTGRPGPECLLIRRASSHGDPWSGHMALPGGKREAADASLLETAIRETREETGIALDRSARMLGRLTAVRPQSAELPPLSIFPFVFALQVSVEVLPRPDEVAEALWTPIASLSEPSNRAVHTLQLGGALREFPAIDLEGRTVWGLTHRILEDFLSRVVTR
jgi:8-oxo-dGTP pyrophosphatase MutT (NUDIX family)